MKLLCPIALILLLFSSPSSGQEEKERALKDEVEMLRDRVAKLSAQVLQLSTENEKLKFEVESLRKRVGLNGGPDNGDPKPATASTNDNKPKLAGRRICTSVADVLVGFPADAMPKGKDGWDKYTIEKAQKWVKETLPGREVDFSLPLVVDPSVRKDSFPADSSRPWEVALIFEKPQGSLAGLPVSLAVDGYQIVLHVDEATARRADLIRKGQRFRVTGAVASASLGQTKRGEGGVDVQISLKLEARKVHGLSPN